MARRKNDLGPILMVFSVICVIAIPILIIQKITDAIGGLAFVLSLLAIMMAVITYFLRKKAKRLEYLRAKYGDELTVQWIMRHQFWQGQTVEQLRDSLGNAVSVDNSLLKTRRREIWKYQPNGKNRYRLRITLDNDVVAGWDQKN